MLVCQLRLGRHERALFYCNTVLEVSDDNAKAYYRRAQAHRALGMLIKAEHDIRKAIELEPNGTRKEKKKKRILFIRFVTE